MLQLSLNRTCKSISEIKEQALNLMTFLMMLFMTFLMMSYVMLLPMLVILLFTLNVIRHMICGNNQNWLLNLNLFYKTPWTGAGSGLLIPMLEKLNQFHLTDVITLVLLIGKWMGLFLRKNHILRYWGWLSLLH